MSTSVERCMSRDSIDRQALLDAGLDPDDPAVWEIQFRVSDLLVCLGIEERSDGRCRHPFGDVQKEK
ncbi:hypothetical protein AB0G00_33785 [Nocardia salmonicida]|uniref:hypothetical protein n=1 Tax=Nocardia salmonicida TaxID=53431 RepID=UPI002E28C869|nr:hypothetical protein [Nocardia salmonicida]